MFARVCEGDVEGDDSNAELIVFVCLCVCVFVCVNTVCTTSMYYYTYAFSQMISRQRDLSKGKGI